MVFLFYSEKNSSSQAIFEILSEEWPLSVKEIQCRLIKTHNLNITYQGIHKKIVELEKERVIVRVNKKLIINQNWLREQISVLQTIDARYSGNSFSLRQLENTPKTHSFRTPMELARFVIDFTLNCDNPHKKPTIFRWWSLYPIFSLSEEEYKQMKKAILINELFIVGKNTTPLDKSLEEEYKKLGAQVKTGVDLPINPDILVVGDYVCHIYLPPKFRSSWKNYSASHGLQKTTKFIKLIPHLYETTDKFNIILTKSPEIADVIRKETKRDFK